MLGFSLLQFSLLYNLIQNVHHALGADTFIGLWSNFKIALSNTAAGSRVRLGKVSLTEQRFSKISGRVLNFVFFGLKLHYTWKKNFLRVLMFFKVVFCVRIIKFYFGASRCLYWNWSLVAALLTISLTVKKILSVLCAVSNVIQNFSIALNKVEIVN